MAAKATRTQEISLPTLGGLNERVSPANLRPGEWAILNGLYPNLVGSLSRIPGKVMLANPGETITSGQINQIWPTYNSQQDVLVQTEGYILRYTLDELMGRESTPSLIITTNPLEETMSYCLIAQKEANGANGGSIDGFLTGTSAASANTFYGARLTHVLQDADSIVTTFTASTGGGGVASVEGTFALAAGTYRITITKPLQVSTGVWAIYGLYNVTDSAFATYAGGSVPIVSQPVGTNGTSATIPSYKMEGRFTISGTKTFALRQTCSGAATAQALTFGGRSYGGGTPTINGSAPEEIFTLVKILKE